MTSRFGFASWDRQSPDWALRKGPWQSSHVTELKKLQAQSGDWRSQESAARSRSSI